MGVQIHVNYSVSDTEYLEQSVNAQTHLLLLKFNRAWIDLHVYAAVGLSHNVQNVRLCMQTGMNEEVDISVVRMYQLVMANTKLQCFCSKEATCRQGGDLVLGLHGALDIGTETLV